MIPDKNIEYRVPLRGIAAMITVSVSMLLLCVGVAMPVYYMFVSDNGTAVVSCAVIVFLVVILTFPVILFLPRKIVLSEKELILKRVVGRVCLPYSDMSMACSNDYYKPFRDIRIFGSGGFFGFIGFFSSRDVGRYRAYICDCSEVFSIKMKDGNRYMFSCERSEDVVLSLERKIKEYSQASVG